MVFSDTNMISAVVTVTGFASDRKINYDITPAMTSQQVAVAVTVLTDAQSASCDSGLEGTVGETANCTVNFPGQPPAKRMVKVAAVDPARLGIELSVYVLIPKEQVAAALMKKLNSDGTTVDSVECASDLASEFGSTATCTAATGSTAQVYDVTAIAAAADGTVDFNYKAR